MEEEVTCRICRSGPEEDMPLYHPCKCNGSIAKVHQDCLIEWLQHSKKKSCELCKTELRFHKVYSPTMPTELPFHLYIRRGLIQYLHLLRFTLRAGFIAILWLALLPLGNIYVWRLHFWIVDVIVWGLAGGVGPHSSSTLLSAADLNDSRQANGTHLDASVGVADHLQSTRSNLTSSLSSGLSVSIPFPFLVMEEAMMRFLDHIEGTTVRVFKIADYKKTVETVAHDVFEGQMLTCAVVVFFVAIFLLREWCLQNLPQPVEGLAFAAPAEPEEPQVGQFPPPGDGVAALQRVEAQVAALREQRVAAEGDVNRARAAMLEAEDDLARARARRQAELQAAPRRPRLRHGVPDPPELQGQTDDWRRETRLTQDGGPGDDTDEEGTGGDVPLSAVEMRKRRMERFGAARESQDGAESGTRDEEWMDMEEEDPLSPLTTGKGKAREEAEEAEGDGSDESVGEASADAGPSNIHSDEGHSDGSSERGQGEWATAEGLEQGTDSDDEAATVNLDEEGEEEEAVAAVMPGHEVLAALPPDELLDRQEWEEEGENAERLEDDLDGLMEAIGMRGPLTNLITNMAMMFFLCSIVLALFVGLPYMIGRLFGVGTNIVKLCTLPIRCLRFFSDPVVDYSIDVAKRISERVLPQAIRKFHFLSFNAPNRVGSLLLAKLKHATNQTQPSLLNTFTARLAHLTQDLRPAADPPASIVLPQSPQVTEALQASLFSMFANLTAHSRRLQTTLVTLYSSAEEKTHGRSQRDKMFCIMLGHLYWLAGLFIQSSLSDFYVRWDLKWLKATVDQQLVVLKVLGFIVLELAIFPWCCGFLLDLSLFPLWDSVTLTSRMALLQSKPLSVCFTQWSMGTLYMFGLAQFVANTRSIVRAGVLCFVRDAGDPNFHPIKDILERKSVEQLRKIGMSALIYSGILASTLGVCTRLLYYADQRAVVLPLRWEMHQSLTTTGAEYLVIAIALPHFINAWLPGSLVKRLVKRWWRMVAHQLRISAYLLGGHFPDEEGHHVRMSWKAKLLIRRADVQDGSEGDDTDRDVWFVRDGGYARVPADDHAIMSCPIVIHTDVDGEPITERGKEAIQAQQEAIAKLSKKPQYTVVYLPPHFRLRIFTLFFALWLSLSCTFLTLLVLPLLVGRTVLDAVVPLTAPPLHDGYSAFLGAFLLVMMLQASKSLRRLVKSSHPRKRFARLARRAAELAWMAAFVWLTSTLLGITVELYINGLGRVFAFSQERKVPDISLLHASSMGMLLQRIIIYFLELDPARNVQIDWANIPTHLVAFYVIRDIRANWRRPKIGLLTRKALVPALGFYLVAILAPILVLATLQSLLGRPRTRVEHDGRTACVFALSLCCIL